MASCLKRAASLRVRAISCVLLLGACRVYDRDALGARVSATQSGTDHNAERTSAVTECADAACPEQACGDAATSCQLPHGDSVCSAGQCLLVRCTDGYRDCDGEPDNGCEVEPDAIEHCGQCQHRCDVAHGSARCVEGQCEMSECEPGFADCDGDGRSCEIELARDLQHCGSCERQCRFNVERSHAAATCAGGGCQLHCDRGFGDCDGAFENGCERALDTTTDCGVCGKTCAVEHASAHCQNGRCELLACEAGYADCDSDKRSCERSLADVASCGACDKRCELTHARTRCSEQAGTCELMGCDDGFADCDAVAANGCERDVRPVAEGGVGPCVPDGSCVRDRFDNRDYFFCSSTRTWDEARSACRALQNGDLAQLRDAATQTYLLSHVTARVWIGHNDLAADGVWIWANTNVPFWQGGLNGRALNGAFVRWSSGEPNSSGRCGALTTSAQMDDLACTVLQPFICEISPDLCPDDPLKTHPGQCGCGVPDTDANRDGFADCPQ